MLVVIHRGRERPERNRHEQHGRDRHGPASRPSGSTGSHHRLPPAPPRPRAASIVQGSQIGKYEIVKLLGKGGMGAVYQAFDPVLEREVALKVMLPEVGGRPRAQAAVRARGARGRPADPSRVVTVFDLGYHTDGSPYIVMELLRGRDLHQAAAGAAAVARARSSRSCCRSWTAWATRTRRGSSTATSSRRTCSSPRTAPRGSWTSASPASRGVRRHRPDRARAPPATCRPSRCAARASTGGATCSASARCCASCSRDGGPSTPRRRWRRSSGSPTARRAIELPAGPGVRALPAGPASAPWHRAPRSATPPRRIRERLRACIAPGGGAEARRSPRRPPRLPSARRPRGPNARDARAARRPEPAAPAAARDPRGRQVGAPAPRVGRRAQEPAHPGAVNRARHERRRRRAPRRRPRPLRPAHPGGPGAGARGRPAASASVWARSSRAGLLDRAGSRRRSGSTRARSCSAPSGGRAVTFAFEELPDSLLETDLGCRSRRGRLILEATRGSRTPSWCAAPSATLSRVLGARGGPAARGPEASRSPRRTASSSRASTARSSAREVVASSRCRRGRPSAACSACSAPASWTTASQTTAALPAAPLAADCSRAADRHAFAPPPPPDLCRTWCRSAVARPPSSLEPRPRTPPRPRGGDTAAAPRRSAR